MTASRKSRTQPTPTTKSRNRHAGSNRQQQALILPLLISVIVFVAAAIAIGFSINGDSLLTQFKDGFVADLILAFVAGSFLWLGRTIGKPRHGTREKGRKPPVG